jgi:hypothetical protein
VNGLRHGVLSSARMRTNPMKQLLRTDPCGGGIPVMQPPMPCPAFRRVRVARRRAPGARGPRPSTQPRKSCRRSRPVSRHAWQRPAERPVGASKRGRGNPSRSRARDDAQQPGVAVPPQRQVGITQTLASTRSVQPRVRGPRGGAGDRPTGRSDAACARKRELGLAAAPGHAHRARGDDVGRPSLLNHFPGERQLPAA